MIDRTNCGQLSVTIFDNSEQDSDDFYSKNNIYKIYQPVELDDLYLHRICLDLAYEQAPISIYVNFQDIIGIDSKSRIRSILNNLGVGSSENLVKNNDSIAFYVNTICKQRCLEIISKLENQGGMFLIIFGNNQKLDLAIPWKDLFFGKVDEMKNILMASGSTVAKINTSSQDLSTFCVWKHDRV